MRHAGVGELAQQRGYTLVLRYSELVCEGFRQKQRGELGRIPERPATKRLGMLARFFVARAVLHCR